MMANRLNTSMSPDPAVIHEIATELGIAPAFVEKDWYAVQVLKCISLHQSDSIATIFSGGTSLSKAYGLIQRFSEDLDFRCRYNSDNTTSQNKKIRSSYRKQIVAEISGLESIILNDNSIQKASNYIKFPLRYPQHYKNHRALRPTLELEFSFTQPRLEPHSQVIQSWVAQFMGAEPEATILCLSPIETAADKVSALTWRVLKRDRKSASDDPTMIRHLHDLSALVDTISNNKDLFVDTTRLAFDEDQRTGKRNTHKAFHQSMQLSLEKLRSESEYPQEYTRFVDAMSYADDEDTITFSDAIANYEYLISLFKQ